MPGMSSLPRDDISWAALSVNTCARVENNKAEREGGGKDRAIIMKGTETEVETTRTSFDQMMLDGYKLNEHTNE